jgi:hypothetical protein
VLMKLPYFLSVKTFYILHNKMKGYSGHLNWYIFFFHNFSPLVMTTIHNCMLPQPLNSHINISWEQN